jgi:hypothetical protein
MTNSKYKAFIFKFNYMFCNKQTYKLKGNARFKNVYYLKYVGNSISKLQIQVAS